MALSEAEVHFYLCVVVSRNGPRENLGNFFRSISTCYTGYENPIRQVPLLPINRRRLFGVHEVGVDVESTSWDLGPSCSELFFCFCFFCFRLPPCYKVAWLAFYTFKCLPKPKEAQQSDSARTCLWGLVPLLILLLLKDGPPHL